ncbi:MAG: helix-turn-helix transcriptional regulator [Nitrosomonadales bacterium]|nr:helix-turn-helix transcriptional regulator [Nitrosomonadales bacterium]
MSHASPPAHPPERHPAAHRAARPYDALETGYALAHEMLSARTRAGLTQEAVADRMGTMKSAASRLEGVGKHAPSMASLKRYAEAVGCTLKIEFIPRQMKRRAATRPKMD